jgi:hypothetical protein
MKIKITQTVEIDPAKWALEYGVDPKNVREDVQSYFKGWFQQQINALGLQPDNAPGGLQCPSLKAP